MSHVPPIMKSAVAIAVLAFATTSAVAQEKYPARPIEMVIPTAAGGGTDIALRMLAELAEPALGQKVVVVNKTGGGGAVGMAGIVQAKPDGYTIGGLWNAPLTMTPHMLPVPYKPSDYAAVSLVATLMLLNRTGFRADEPSTAERADAGERGLTAMPTRDRGTRLQQRRERQPEAHPRRRPADSSPTTPHRRRPARRHIKWPALPINNPAHVVQKPSVAPSSRSVVRHPRTNGEMARAARVRARQQRRNAKPRLGLAAR